MASTIQQVASGAVSQLQATEESARAMTEMSTGIQRIAESTSTISQAAMDTTIETQEGNHSVQKAVGQMQLIKNSVESTSSLVKSLGERSNEISHILDVIAGIASQTNLLALNAAIEAARAGEHGRGFAVVADEVRKLAEQSNESANQIAHLIHEIQQDTAGAVVAMDTVNQHVLAGLEVVQEAGTAFQRISSEITTIAEQMQESSAVAEQMSASSEEITASIDQTASIARESADFAQSVATFSTNQLQAMDELASSAESLRSMAAELSGLVRKYRV